MTGWAAGCPDARRTRWPCSTVCCACSDAWEGGLLEYPSDDEMVENLRVLAEETREDFAVIGTVVRDAATLDPRLAPMEGMAGRPAIRFIGVDGVRKLAERAGWRVTCVGEEAIHQVVALRRETA